MSPRPIYQDVLPYVVDRKINDAKVVEFTFNNGYKLFLIPPPGRVEHLEEFLLTDGHITLAHYAHGAIEEDQLRIHKRYLAEILNLANSGYLQWICPRVSILASKVVAEPLLVIANQLTADLVAA